MCVVTARDLVGEDGVQLVVLARLDDERQLRQPRPERLHEPSPASSVGRGRCVLRASGRRVSVSSRFPNETSARCDMRDGRRARVHPNSMRYSELGEPSALNRRASAAPSAVAASLTVSQACQPSARVRSGRSGEAWLNAPPDPAC